MVYFSLCCVLMAAGGVLSYHAFFGCFFVVLLRSLLFALRWSINGADMLLISVSLYACAVCGILAR